MAGQQYNTQQQAYLAQQNQMYNQLAGVAGFGQAANTQYDTLAGLGIQSSQNYSTGVGNNLLGIGNLKGYKLLLEYDDRGRRNFRRH